MSTSSFSKPTAVRQLDCRSLPLVSHFDTMPSNSQQRNRHRLLTACFFVCVSLVWVCWAGPALPTDSPGSSRSVLDESLLVQASPRQDARELAPSPERPPLVARHNGSTFQFKILQFADLHFTGVPSFECRNPPEDMIPSDCTEALMTKFMNDVLDFEKPDMVVFTGDNVETNDTDHHQVAMDYATNPVEERQIPWAMVFGNHDHENGFSREEIYRIAAAKKHSYIQHGPKDVDGVGNYELSVMDPTASRALLRLYFLDSHAYANKAMTNSTYDWIKPNQISFYKKLSDSHRQERVPAMMFFHIPIPEYELTSADTQSGGEKPISGEKNEPVSSPTIGNDLLSTLAKQEEVKAVFVGHDHVNEYCIERQGIQLCYGGGSGFGQAYGSDRFARRVRLIEWSQQDNGPRVIRSWKRHHTAIDQPRNVETLFQDNGSELVAPSPSSGAASRFSNHCAFAFGVMVVSWLARS